MNPLSRRDFLKLSALWGAGAALRPSGLWPLMSPLPVGEPLGRITELEARLFSRPRADSRELGRLGYDEIVPALRQVMGRGVYPHNNVWVETPDGYIWSSDLQPVRHAPHPILDSIPEEGVWTEVSVPFVDGLSRPEPAAPVRYRLYYAMILNVDGRVVGADGTVYYRVHDENNIVMYAPGESFRVIPPEEVAPIQPEIEDKYIRINLTRQDLSAMEAGIEVYYTRVSSGYAVLEDGVRRWNTPVGQQWTWRKMISRHMSGGDRVTGYDLPGVGWTILFSGMGAAIHSTYWHNDFGTPRSRGCINVRPEDARWLFRWSLPYVDYRPGDVTIQGLFGSRVIVEE
jgi:hypothetical protein